MRRCDQVLDQTDLRYELLAKADGQDSPAPQCCVGELEEPEWERTSEIITV
jgi:hypothetical protein